MDHPCLRCGACCASFRVAFHWLETGPAGGGQVPSALTVKLDAHRVAMHGTDQRKPHCLSLRGKVGTDASCDIYAVRPSPCRDLGAAWEHGEPSPQCDRARAIHGLPALGPGDWAL
jgi:Fe-S-cluster containining protein